MSALHMVMNPRWIPECMDAFADLDIDTCYLRGMTQEHLIPHVAEVVETTDYDHYVMSSDDVVVTQDALDAVLGLLEAGHPVVTGWCRMDQTHPMVNLTSAPLIGAVPRDDAYPLRTYDECASWPDEIIPTGLVNMAVTGMTRELWLEYPFDVFGYGAGGWASDFNLSIRLRDAGVPMIAPKRGYVEHVKERWGHKDEAPEKQLLIGRHDPEIVMVTAAPA